MARRHYRPRVLFISAKDRYAGLITKSITPERNLFGATFFTLTGFHGFQ